MSMDLIIEDSAPGVRLLRLNRSASLNALSGALLSAMADELQRVEADEVVRCVVLTGDERAFSAGADLKEMPQSDLPIYAEANRLKAWKTIERFSKPLIAAVRGYALGGGCELALLCDIVIAGKGAKFGTPEIKVGMFPGDGGTQRLPRAIGKARAMLMILTGEPIDGATAASWGSRPRQSRMTRSSPRNCPGIVDRAALAACGAAREGGGAYVLCKAARREPQP